MWDAEKNRICSSSPLCGYGLFPAVPHFITQKSFTEGVWLGLAILWWLVNLLEDANNDTDTTTTDTDASC